MILRPAQIYQLRIGRPVTPANFGGHSNSDSSTNTTNDTKNFVTSTDKRAVASDQAVSLTGDNNVIDRSTSNLTQFFDSSNRSTTNLTQFTDTSNRSTNFTDNSNRSVTTINTGTDYGAIGSAIGLNGQMTTKALDVADNAIGGAVDVLKLQTATGSDIAARAFDLAKSSAANSLGTSAQVLGFASDAISKTADAFENAKDGGQSKMVLAALCVAGAVGVAVALRK